MKKTFYFFLKDYENIIIVMYDKSLKKQFFFHFKFYYNDIVIGRLQYNLEEIKRFFSSQHCKEIQTFEIFFNKDILEQIKKIINIYKEEDEYYLNKFPLDILRMSGIKKFSIAQKALDRFLLNFKKYYEKELR